MSNSTGMSVYVEGEPLEIEAGSLSYGLYIPKYDPTPTIKAGQRATVASEKLDDNMQTVKFRIIKADVKKLKAIAKNKGSKGLDVSVTNGVERVDYKNMFVSSDTDLNVEDNGKPTTEVSLTGTEVDD